LSRSNRDLPLPDFPGFCKTAAMRFTKMHGCGNDYIYVDCFSEPYPKSPTALSRVVSDRHFGIGGDGLILICPSEVADARMRMFNADGSEAEMCGNGIRCVGKYVYEHGLARKPRLRIETGRGILTLDVEVSGGKVQRVRVDMGEPILEAARVPTTLAGRPPANAALVVDGVNYAVTCVSMGNPHCVQFVDDVDRAPVATVGPRIENDPHFPQRTNVEFVQVLSRGELRMRVWERGSGETWACGTGACAVAVASALTGRTDRRIVAHLRGGDLELDWAADGHVYMTGPAVEVFSGEWKEE
jgi:diaminopimelate epimerase